MDDEEDEEPSTETKITTKNMQIETGVTILTISSPRESRTLLGLEFWAIGCPKPGSISLLDAALIGNFGKNEEMGGALSGSLTIGRGRRRASEPTPVALAVR